jgi:hypothetical protein
MTVVSALCGCALSVRLVEESADLWESSTKRSCCLGSGRKSEKRRRDVVLNCRLSVGELDWNTCDPWLRVHGLRIDLAWFQVKRRSKERGRRRKERRKSLLRLDVNLFVGALELSPCESLAQNA